MLTSAIAYEGVIQGLYMPDTSIAVHCPTGNCTWPEYKTLGVCISCNDYTSSTTVTCSPESNATKYDANTEHFHGDEPYYYGKVINCRWQTSNGLRSNVSYMEFTTQDMPTTWSLVGRPSTSFADMHPDNDFVSGTAMNITFVELPNSFPWSGSDTSPIVPTAQTTVCAFSLCEKTYLNSSCSNGVLTENVLSSEPLMFQRAKWCSDTSQSRNTMATKCIGVLSSRFQDVSHVSYKSFVESDEDLYWINEFSAGQLWTDIQETLTEGARSEYLSTLGKNALTSIFDSNHSLMLESVATAMTEKIRNNPNGTMSAGHAWSSVTIIRVRWLWAIYPVVLLVAAIVFWSCTIAFSGKSGTLVWKSCSLPLLLHDVQDWDSADLHLPSIHEMKSAAERMKRQLVLNGSGAASFKA